MCASDFYPHLSSEVLPAIISDFSGTPFRKLSDYTSSAANTDKIIQTPEAVALVPLHLLIAAEIPGH